MTNWPVKTLGEVCDFVRGVTYNKADARSEIQNGFIPLLRATNITENGILHEDYVFIPKNGVRADQKLMSGDALITIASGSASVVGRSVLVEDPGEMTFGAFCGVLRPSPEILPRYLSHFMSSRTVRTAWSEAAQGTNINNLKRDDILQTECLLPPLEEQKRIVALLDDATARITELTACYEQARTCANNLFASALRDALEGNPDWPFKNLGEVCEVLDSLRKPITKRDRVAGNYPYYGATGIVDFVADYIFDERLVLVGEDGAKWGAGEKTAFIAEGRYWVNNHAHVLRCKSDVIVDSWLTNFLNMSDLNRYVSGLTVPKLNQGSLVSIEIPVPPLEEQKHIVSRMDQMRVKTSEMIAACDAKLQAAKNLRQSILEAAFAGEL